MLLDKSLFFGKEYSPHISMKSRQKLFGIHQELVSPYLYSNF